MKYDFSPFLRTISEYVDGRLSAAAFDESFRELWRHLAEEENVYRTPKLIRQEESLFKQLESGAISDESYSEQWRQLHGYTMKEELVLDILGALHSTSSNYTTDAELLATGTYVREPELLAHAKQALEVLKKFQDNSRQDKR